VGLCGAVCGKRERGHISTYAGVRVYNYDYGGLDRVNTIHVQQPQLFHNIALAECALSWNILLGFISSGFSPERCGIDI
jgi:hypothetical protein